MPFAVTSSKRLLNIYLALAQYPILSSRIREGMRAELFQRGIVTRKQFENEVMEAAIHSQQREGLTDPLSEESIPLWDLRVNSVRDQLTDLAFSQHLSLQDFEKIVSQVLAERGIAVKDMLLSLNPELAPQELVFDQAMTIEHLPAEERAPYEPRLQETKVVLIRRLISDQLQYINIAKDWFTISDLAEVRRRKIGAGRIGGKAAGMLLAMRILEQTTDASLSNNLKSAESFFIGADEFYNFMSVNNLTHWNDQKYKSEPEMRADYPTILKEYNEGEFAPDLVEKFESILAMIGPKPIIVRSSSLLEDNFGTSFAGKYESIFLPNQGKPDENLKALTSAVARVYGSTLNPNALLYRRQKGLQDYDERMAILMQVVQGERYGKYFLPHGAGVAFSRNLYRWTPLIRREDGFVRLVWGLGTRAVDRVGNDYPRLIALSHPLLRPSTNPKTIRRYSQQFVDLIDLEANEFRSLPIHEVLDSRYPPLRYLAQMDEDGYFVSLQSSVLGGDQAKLVLTFDELLRRTSFAEQMREMLQVLEKAYGGPVDMEFTIQVEEGAVGKPTLRMYVLQCRPQSHLAPTEQMPMPTDLRQEDIVFSTHFVVPEGHVPHVDLVVFIPPEKYFGLETQNRRFELARAIGRLNAALEKQAFICVGPGRWGSSNSGLGVPIDYGDIYNSKALVEIAGKEIGPEPEPSLGTHFFQDLLEAQIYPLAIYLDDAATVFNRQFFYHCPNRVREWIEVDDVLFESLHLIRVSDYRARSHMRIVMNDEMGQAMAFIPPEGTRQRRKTRLVTDADTSQERLVVS